MNAREYLEILHIAEKLKDTPRHCTTSNGRVESVAEHSWRISLMAFLLRHEFPDANIDKVVDMCLIHDLGECFTGDIPTFLKTDSNRKTEDNLIGEFRIRHHLTEALRNGAGHIGYSIGKSYRGKGYGTAGLGLTIQLAKDIVPEEEIYLRVNKDNMASQKCMLANGAYKAGEDEEHYFMRIPKL